MPSLDNSVKCNGKVDKIYKALEDTFDNGEDDDDMSNEKEATNSIESDQNRLGSNHKAIGRNERIDNVTESAFSEGNGIQIYLDDNIVYDGDNKENEVNHNARGFINIDDIIDYLIPKRNVLEKPEFNITESHSNNNESKKGKEGSDRELKTNNQVT